MTSMISSDPKAKKNHQSKDCLSKINQGIPRLDKAYQILDKIVLTSDTTATCPSSKDPMILYHINFSDNTCECPDNQIRQSICKHIRGAKIKDAMRKTEMVECRDLVQKELLE